MKKKLFSIYQLNKYFKKKYLLFSKKKQSEKEESNIGSIFRTLLASLLIIAFFSISPVVLEFTKKTSITSADFENNSKNDLNKLL